MHTCTRALLPSFLAAVPLQVWRCCLPASRARMSAEPLSATAARTACARRRCGRGACSQATPHASQRSAAAARQRPHAGQHFQLSIGRGPRAWRQHAASSPTETQPGAETRRFPAFLPPEVSEITEPAAIDVAHRCVRLPVRLAGGAVIETACVVPATRGRGLPLVLLHGFDSSLFEFRRFLPLVEDSGVETWAVDLYGCGHTAYTGGGSCTPADRLAHLHGFLQQHVGTDRACVVLGASLGAATAIDLATTHPALVAGLVIVDGQVFERAPALQGPLAWLGVSVLRSVWLRNIANQVAYADKARYATQDAMRVGRLHTHLPHWAEASVAFMASGGYNVAERVASITQRTLVVWGADDEIVPPDTAERLRARLRNCAGVAMVPACGHVAHLEQPEALRDLLLPFLAELGGSVA